MKIKAQYVFVALILLAINLSSSLFGRVPDAGVYAIWASDAQEQAPYVKGFQIVFNWGGIPSNYDPVAGKGGYDFSAIGAKVAAMNPAMDAGNASKGTVQINGGTHPDWMFTYDGGPVKGTVPYCTDLSGWDSQVADSLGVPMYWHPSYLAEYENLLEQLDVYLNDNGLYPFILGFRLNFNAIGTEKFGVAHPYSTGSAKWVIPSIVDAASVVPVNEVLKDAYQLDVVQAYCENLAYEGASQVFCRNNVDAAISDYLDTMEADGLRISWFHTSSELEPKARWEEKGQYQVFRDDCLPGYRAGYAEPYASAWGDHGSNKHEEWYEWSSPPQYHYWTGLLNMHCGVSYIAVYGKDLNVAIDGSYNYVKKFPAAGNPVEQALFETDVYKDEFTSGLEFMDRYAGYHADPTGSPGAWVAFRENLVANRRNHVVKTDPTVLYLDDAFKYDYTMLVDSVVVPDRSSKKNELESTENHPTTQGQTILEERNYDIEKTVGPSFRRYGAFALRMVDGDVFEVDFDDTFIDSLQLGSTLRLVALNDGSQSAQVLVGTENSTTTLQVVPNVVTIAGAEFNDWSEFEVAIDATMLADLRNGLPVQIDSVGAGQTDIWLHMLEIKREEATPVFVDGVSLDRRGKGLKLYDSYQFTATVSPADATNKGLVWTSSNPEVVKVNQDGVAFAVGRGHAKITVTTEDGGFAATSTIGVMPFVRPSIAEDFSSGGSCFTPALNKGLEVLEERKNHSKRADRFARFLGGILSRLKKRWEKPAVGASRFTPILGGVWTWDEALGRYVLSDFADDQSTGLLSNISVHDFVFLDDYYASGILNVAGLAGNYDDVALVFGYKDPLNYYYVSLNESNNGNTHGLFKVVGGSWTQIAEFDDATRINSDTDYLVEVYRYGGTIEINLDGALIASVDGEFSHAGGQVGFASRNNDGQFDDLLGYGEEIDWVRGISLSPTSLDLFLDQTANLEASIYPSDATNQVLGWESSDPSVASVDSNGLVTATGDGVATITVTTDDGGFTGICEVAVTNVVHDVTLEEGFSEGAEGFDSGSGGDWAWDSSIGRYTLSSASASSQNGYLANISLHEAVFSGDFSFSAIVNARESGDDKDDVAFVFGYKDAQNFYYVSLSENNNATTHGLFKVMNGHRSQIADFSDSSRIVSGTDYIVEIYRIGDLIEVYLDGELLASVSGESSFVGGQVGFASYDNDAQFDNFVAMGDIVGTPVSGIEVSPTSLSLLDDETAVLTATVSPVDATVPDVVWSSSDPLIATVDQSGTVTAVGFGFVTVTATSVDGGYTADCSVAVATPAIAEDFSTGADDMVPVLGGAWSWSSSLERYRLTGSANDKPNRVLSNISVHKATFTGDYLVSGIVNVVGWGGVYDDVSLVFGLQDEDNYYYVALNETNTSNSHGLFKVEDGVGVQLQDFSVPVKFVSNTDYTIKVRRTGSQILVSVDGVVVNNYNDSTFIGGQVGFASKDNYAQFDDLLAYGSVAIIEEFSVDSVDPESFTEIRGGDWAAYGGRYVLSSPANIATGYLGDITVHNAVLDSNYVVEVTFSVSNTNAFDDAALVFDFQDVNNHYYASLNESNNGGTHGFFKVENGVWSQVADFGAGALILNDVDYRIKVVRVGDTAEAYLDGVLIGTMVDSSFSGGQIGFGTKNDPVSFDDLLIVD